MAGLKSARARGRKGGRKFALTKAQVRMAQAAMASRDTSVSDLCKELGVTPVTLYRYVDPNGNLCGKACKDDPLGGKSASSLTHLASSEGLFNQLL